MINGLILFALFTSSAASLTAASIDEKSQDLATLQARADATPKEQCYLYAEMAHQMVEQAGRQMSAGDTEKIPATLDAFKQYTDRIHGSLGTDGKKLKDAEILMRHTAFRLNELLHNASTEDQPRVAAALKRFEQVRGELMLAIFRH